MSYFIVYTSESLEERFMQFQQKCGQNFTIFDRWTIAENEVILLQQALQPAWIDVAHQLGLDIAPIDFTPRLSQAGLLVMDMDSTAIQIECIDEIAKLAGTGEQVAKITAQAMRGELDFEQSLRQRVATLANASMAILTQVQKDLPLMPGLVESVKLLQKNGWKIAIASGGFTYFADYLKETLGLDYAVSNQLEIQGERLTGKVKGEVVTAQYKADTLIQLAEQYQIDLAQTVAIGDGANDLLMMSAAGLGVALHAKPKVQQQAKIVINFADFSGLLCVLSANDRIRGE
ncbi:phosphoserine phosphatase [Volucribacter psittacicida]|uniref:Phosphoserine phosphatase n=1 Tax=Volucribacter psittacicida TaxID=203482 RepID=A0A4R1FXC9_9PAST|nr:phosphoserine phosphatase [Volucribacter psittacicida]TCJ98414.1 phosphoserine phosphatase [Volucribacter psittacicida]